MEFRRTATGMLLASALATGILFAVDDRGPAPRFSAKTLDGERFTNASITGRPVLIQFWATWCNVCRGDQEAVDNIARDYADQDLLVLAVDVGESKHTVRSYLDRNPRQVRIVANEDTNLPALFDSRAVPTYVLIDKNGNVVGTQKGSTGERGLRDLLWRARLR